MLAASAVLISGPASVSNFQEEPLEITTFNSLSWPPGILPPPSATEKKKKKRTGVGGRRGEESGRGEGRTKWYLYDLRCASLFSPDYMPHPQRWNIDGGFGLVPESSGNRGAGWGVPRAGWNFPVSGSRQLCWGAFPGAGQERQEDLQRSANPTAPDTPDTEGLLGISNINPTEREMKHFPEVVQSHNYHQTIYSICSSTQISE